MGPEALTAEQKRGVKVGILVLMLVLLLFVAILVAGHPIMKFGTEPLSVAYAVGIYVPVIALCLLAYRRLGRS